MDLPITDMTQIVKKAAYVTHHFNIEAGKINIDTVNTIATKYNQIRIYFL